MATAASDCDTVALGYTVITPTTANVPTYWTGVQGGGLPLDPENPSEYEVEHRIVNSGALNTFSLNVLDTALCQEITAYGEYGNVDLSIFRRYKTVDPELPTGWTAWLKVE